MYGIPKDLPLQKFVGKQCIQIALGVSDIQFRFDDDHEVSVEDGWEVMDASGRRIDHSQDHSARTTYRVHTILESPVEAFRIDAPKSFTLFFQNGYALTIFDGSDRFESFSIQPGSIYI